MIFKKVLEIFMLKLSTRKMILGVIVGLFSMTQLILGEQISKLRSDTFKSGDAIRINIIEVTKLSGSGQSSFSIDNTFPIDSDGNVFMPFIGELKVTGLTQEGLTKLLAEKYNPYFKDIFIAVTPLIRVNLMGAFIKPGSYRIDPEASLWELINMAQGPLSECNLNSLHVKRGNQVVIKDLLTSFEKGHSLKEIGIHSGDQVIAFPKRSIGVREIIDYIDFGVSLVVLYLQIDRYRK
jgi:protein involved in polysaccharide export with SLBB domain